MTVISPICIDLGAKNTGLYLSHYNEGEDPTNEQIDKDGKEVFNIIWFRVISSTHQK